MAPEPSKAGKTLRQVLQGETHSGLAGFPETEAKKLNNDTLQYQNTSCPRLSRQPNHWMPCQTLLCAAIRGVSRYSEKLIILRFDHVTKEYRTDQETVSALVDISLEVASGEFVALVGRSGCGKTTLLNLAGAMDFPTSGSVLLGSINTSELDERKLTHLRRTKIGFVFQFFHLLPTLTGVENVELPLMLAGETNGHERALESLRWVDMEAYAKRLPHQLSGGQMQRIAIARALVHRPKILLADEPIGNLDTAAAEIVMDLLQRTAKEQGTTVLMATHSLEAAAASDTVVRLRDGQIEHVKRKGDFVGS